MTCGRKVGGLWVIKERSKLFIPWLAKSPSVRNVALDVGVVLSKDDSLYFFAMRS